MTLLFCIVADSIFPLQTVGAVNNDIEWRPHPDSAMRVVKDGRPVVLVVGTLRHGKSHLLNVIAGRYDTNDAGITSDDTTSSYDDGSSHENQGGLIVEQILSLVGFNVPQRTRSTR